MLSAGSKFLCAIISGLAAGFLWHYPIKWFMKWQWGRFFIIVPEGEKLLGGREIHDKVQPFACLMGIIERIVYACGWIFGMPEIIAIILVLKATPSFKLWSENEARGRAAFNIWLSGNLFSIIGSVVIAEIIRLIFLQYFSNL